MGKKNSISFCTSQPQKRFESSVEFCPRCQRLLKVEKSRTRRLVTLDSDERVTEVVKYCPVDGSRFVSESLRNATPSRSPYSYDLIVRIGRLRYSRHYQIVEIQDEIARDGPFIPRSSVQRLCFRFLRYFIAVHLESLSLFADYTWVNGGYVLQIDGSQNHGRGTLILVKDMISGMRLFTARFPSENKEDLVPFLRYMKSVFDVPLVVIRDGGTGIVNALDDVFPDTYQVYCHFHFLRALGHALFDHYRRRFKNAIDKLGVKGQLNKLYRLVQKQQHRGQKRFVREVLNELHELLSYVLNYSGEGLGYPFELRALRFYERCLEIEKPVHDLVKKCAEEYVYLQSLCDVKKTLRLLHPPPAVRGKIQMDAERLLDREKWFNESREALRWRNGPVPLSTKIRWSDEHLKKARKRIDDFLKKVKSEQENKRNSKPLIRALQTIEDRFTKYQDNLLVPNIRLDTVDGEKVIKVERTNNGIEQDFRACRRHARRLRGEKNVEGVIQREGVGLLLLLNMDISQYIQIVYGSWECMGTRFSKVEEWALERADMLLQGYNPWWAL